MAPNIAPDKRQGIKADGDFEGPQGWNTIQLIAQDNKASQIVNGRIVNTLFDMEAEVSGDPSRYSRIDRGRGTHTQS